MFKHAPSRPLLPLGVVALQICLSAAAAFGQSQGTPLQRPPLVFKVQSPSERLEMLVNSSRILTTDQKVPQAQVNNPDILELTPLSPSEIQISAKTAGVTQVTLWGEDKKVYTIDVIVFGDAQALSVLLQSQFPSASLKVIPVSHGVLITGYVDRPEHVDLIVRIAEEYYPKVINAITVGGVQQVVLHVKVMEVSRTKLRNLGFDWAEVTGSNAVVSGISGLIPGLDLSNIGQNATFKFNVVNGSSAFFGVLEALRQDDLATVTAEPKLVTVSGRPASFNVGGEFPVPIPQSLGTLSIEFKKFGTQLDFVPIVLGNGKIRLEVRPRVSELDRTNSVTVQGTTVPGIRMREVETGVEMQAGQTLAIAGLVQKRVEAQNRGLPWISEVPYLGAAFRKVHHQTNEIELLIMVTPELVEPMDPCQVPPCGPGSRTTSPSDWELFMKGFPEVPNCCPNCGGAGCDQCAPGGNGPHAPDGMIGPVEETQAPGPAGAALRSGAAAATAKVPSAQARTAARPTGPQNTYNPANAKSPPANSRAAAAQGEPAFLGPIGYDDVK